MRLQSKIKVKAGEKNIGGAHPLICLPLVAQTLSELSQAAEKIIRLTPDLIEWRVDHFKGHQDPAVIISTLAVLREKVGTIPLLFTCRNVIEGGCSTLCSNELLALNLAAAASGRIELLDTEISSSAHLVGSLKAECKRSGVKLVLSYHNFDHTPEQNFLIDQLITARDLGAHIAKIAVMPNNPGDVLTLLNAAYIARTQKIDIPIIAISMGQLGAISRIAGGIFGSDITFAVGQESSAPGQIPIADLRLHWEMMY